MSSTQAVQEVDTTEEEEIILPVQQTKTKPKRTEAQLAVLASAREKAILVRRGNAELRKKEKELIKMEKEEDLRERREKLDRLLTAKGKKPPTYQEVVPQEEEEEAEEIIYKKKKKPRKQKIVYVSGSDSDDEEPKVVYKRKPKQPQATRFQEEAPPTPQVVYTQHGAIGTIRRYGT